MQGDPGLEPGPPGLCFSASAVPYSAKSALWRAAVALVPHKVLPRAGFKPATFPGPVLKPRSFPRPVLGLGCFQGMHSSTCCWGKSPVRVPGVSRAHIFMCRASSPGPWFVPIPHGRDRTPSVCRASILTPGGIRTRDLPTCRWGIRLPVQAPGMSRTHKAYRSSSVGL